MTPPARDYRTGVAVRTLPPTSAQEQCADRPCERCDSEGLPHLVANDSELYWEHQHVPPGKGMRSGCPRYGRSEWCGGNPRSGTVVQ